MLPFGNFLRRVNHSAAIELMLGGNCPVMFPLEGFSGIYSIHRIPDWLTLWHRFPLTGTAQSQPEAIAMEN
jgi:hypothetical protein